MSPLARDVAKGVAVVVLSAGVLWGIRKVIKGTIPSLLND